MKHVRALALLSHEHKQLFIHHSLKNISIYIKMRYICKDATSSVAQNFLRNRQWKYFGSHQKTTHSPNLIAVCFLFNSRS